MVSKSNIVKELKEAEMMNLLSDVTFTEFTPKEMNDDGFKSPYFCNHDESNEYALWFQN